MKIVFMGTPDFAASALEALIQEGHEVTLVVTQPDKPKGRSKELMPSPVKVCAMKYELPVFQPVRIKRLEAIEELKKYQADIFVVAAFGQILSQEILDMPRFGSVNIHASLLPKYRGASPIQHVIVDGEEKTGITIMQMDAGIDTGDMLYKKEVIIENTDTFETLHDKLAVAGAEAIVEALPLLEAGKLIPEKQKEEESSHVTMIDKEMGRLDFAKEAVVLDRLIRGFNPWPSAFTSYKGKQLKVWEARVEDGTAEAACGEITEVTKNEIKVQTGKGILCITSLQLEGKKRMSTHDFLLGVKVAAGEKLG